MEEVLYLGYVNNRLVLILDPHTLWFNYIIAFCYFNGTLFYFLELFGIKHAWWSTGFALTNHI